MKKNLLCVSILLIVLVMLAYMAIPAFAYYREPDMEWVDDYSDFSEAERYLNENITNYFLSAAYDLRYNGRTDLVNGSGYALNEMSTEVFYKSVVPRNEKGEIVVPPLVLSGPFFALLIPSQENKIKAYYDGKTHLTEKMLALLIRHSQDCYSHDRPYKPNSCIYEKAAVQTFLAPWTLYQNGEFYTWEDIAQMSETDLGKINMSSYAFYKYISSVKDVLVQYGWWKEEYTDRYNTLYAHVNDWENSLEDKTTFDYKGKKRYYAEIAELVKLYGNDTDMILFSDEFDVRSDEFKLAVKNAPVSFSSFKTTYFDKIFENNENKDVDWFIFMSLYLKGNTEDSDKTFYNMRIKYCRGFEDAFWISRFAYAYEYFKSHPISASELENELLSQVGLSNYLSESTAKEIAKLMTSDSAYDFADYYKYSDYYFAINPYYSPLDIRYNNSFELDEMKKNGVPDRERAIKELNDAYAYYYQQNPDPSPAEKEKVEKNYKDALDFIENAPSAPVTADSSAVWFVIAVSAVALCAVPLSLRKRRMKF